MFQNRKLKIKRYPHLQLNPSKLGHVHLLLLGDDSMPFWLHISQIILTNGKYTASSVSPSSCSHKVNFILANVSRHRGLNKRSLRERRLCTFNLSCIQPTRLFLYRHKRSISHNGNFPETKLGYKCKIYSHKRNLSVYKSRGSRVKVEGRG